MRELLKGLWEAETYSLRGSLLKFAVVSLGVTGWMAATGVPGIGIVAGLVAFVVLLCLALAAQRWAERRGAVERERERREQRRQAWRDELAGWPRWKRVAFFPIASVLFVVAMTLRLATR